MIAAQTVSAKKVVCSGAGAMSARTAGGERADGETDGARDAADDGGVTRIFAYGEIVQLLRWPMR